MVVLSVILTPGIAGTKFLRISTWQHAYLGMPPTHYEASAYSVPGAFRLIISGLSGNYVLSIGRWVASDVVCCDLSVTFVMSLFREYAYYYLFCA